MSAAHLESPLPVNLPAGSSIAVFCSGTCCEPVDLELVVSGRSRRAAAFAMPRFDIQCRRSGFWGVVPVQAPEGSAEIELAAQVRDSDGHSDRVPLGTIAVVDRAASPSLGSGGAEPPVVICMGTFDPDAELFRRQVESLRGQTAQDWICVISDDCSSPDRYQDMLSVLAADDRFVVTRSERRIGFYRNFERALLMVPPEARLIALCDQDDIWHPDKLALLRGALGSAMLVYSDQRLVDPSGRVLRETLWRGRRNNFTSIGSMLVANTVTGAASLFRRDVLERALPFPDTPGNDFHDHWIALVAIASGSIAYVNRPLYDYVQHGSAVLTQDARHKQRQRDRRRPIGRRSVGQWRSAYFFGYVPGEVRARTLLLRCGDRLSLSKRRTLERYLAGASSAAALAWLFLRPLRALAGRTETLGTEWQLVRGLAWLRLARLIALAPWWPDRWTPDTRLPDPATFEQKRLRRWRERI